MSQKRRVKRRATPKHLLEWLGYLLIASVPIAVLLMVLNPSPIQQPEYSWSRTLAQTTTLAQPKSARPKTAAILDQVATYDVNQELITNTRGYLVRAGYNVDVFSGAQVTVDLYRKLPSMKYGVIFLRVHSTSIHILGQQHFKNASIVLFTGEQYNQLRYPHEQLTGQLVPAVIGARILFGIKPGFVGSMEGTFPDTLIILAGCQSLINKEMAMALVSKGASCVVGWSDDVSLSHNDRAIALLARALFEMNLSLPEAIQVTMEEIGRDPDSQSYLLFYP